MDQLYEWDRLAEIPSEAGLYAWYYRPMLPIADLHALRVTLEGVKDRPTAREVVREFLEASLLGFVSPSRYQAECWGDLMPRYRGTLEHVPPLGDDYLDRLAAEPSILEDIRITLRGLGAFFSAPLYIGMSQNLRQRISQHAAVISADVRMGPRVTLELPADWSPEERSFALEVRRRHILSSRLAVAVRLTPAVRDPRDTEYLLNRICFPVFGSR